MATDRKTRVLVVDDDPRVTEFVTRVLDTHACDYRVATNGEQALRADAAFAPAVVLLSVSIPDQDGWLVCCKLKGKRQPPRIVLTTRNLDDVARRFARFVSADAILPKPLSKDDLDKTVDIALSSLAKK
jgi:DNA-binding response OmpR family regulator